MRVVIRDLTLSVVFMCLIKTEAVLPLVGGVFSLNRVRCVHNGPRDLNESNLEHFTNRK